MHALNRSTAIVALMALTACSAGQTSPAAPTNGVVYDGPTAVVNGVAVTAWRPNVNSVGASLPALPEPSAKSNPKYYEYIFNNYSTYASIFDYPTSDKQIGSIPKIGGQGCTNVLYGYGKKTFWNVQSYDNISEYSVIKKRIKTLSISGSQPSSCAMNSNGDLAVGILTSTQSGPAAGDLIIFKNASGTGTVMTTALDEEFFDGYDDKGNLFADGYTGSIGNLSVALVELPKGGSSFETIQTSNKLLFPGSVQFDGTYLTVYDQEASTVYRYTVKGTKATLKGSVKLSGVSDCAQTWIATGIIYCADAGNDNSAVYAYPAGGSPLAVFTGKFDLPLGVVAVEK
jgi:hypothetical protein